MAVGDQRLVIRPNWQESPRKKGFEFEPKRCGDNQRGKGEKAIPGKETNINKMLSDVPCGASRELWDVQWCWSMETGATISERCRV